MAYKTIQIQDQAGNDILQKWPISAVIDGGASARYRIFAKMQILSYNDNISFTALVSGTDNYANRNQGVYLVECAQRRGSTNARVTPLSAPSTAPTFGYYSEGGWAYVGVMVTSNYPQRTTVMLLNGGSHEQFWAVGNIATMPSEPEGWTPIAIS